MIPTGVYKGEPFFAVRSNSCGTSEFDCVFKLSIPDCQSYRHTGQRPNCASHEDGLFFLSKPDFILFRLTQGATS